MTLIYVMPWSCSRMVSTRERVIPGAGQARGGEWGLVMHTHLHLGNSSWPFSVRKVALANLLGNADIPSCAELPALEIMTAVFPLCSLMQCMC